MNEKKLIGIFGGTFNPIHTGHLIMAEAVRCEYHLDKILFIPAKIPPHKQLNPKEMPTPEQRYRMVELAIQHNPFFEISDIEMKRAGKSYSVDTVKQLLSENRDGAKFFFLIGADIIREIATWERVHELLSLCEFIAAERPGCSPEESVVMLRQQMGEIFAQRIHTLKTPEIAISSTDVRRRIHEKISIKYFVPEAVEAFIFENHLYQ